MAKDMEDEMLDRITRLGPNETDGPVKTAPIAADYLDAMIKAAKSAKKWGFRKEPDGYHIYDNGKFIKFVPWNKEYHDFKLCGRLEQKNKRREMEAAYNAAREYFAAHGGLAELVQWADPEDPFSKALPKVPERTAVSIGEMPSHSHSVPSGFKRVEPEKKPIDFLAINKMFS